MAEATGCAAGHSCVGGAGAHCWLVGKPCYQNDLAHYPERAVRLCHCATGPSADADDAAPTGDHHGLRVVLWRHWPPLLSPHQNCNGTGDLAGTLYLLSAHPRQWWSSDSIATHP